MTIIGNASLYNRATSRSMAKTWHSAEDLAILHNLARPRKGGDSQAVRSHFWDDCSSI